MNYTSKIEGHFLHITMDISPDKIKAAKVSGSGKSKLVASTQGTIRVEGTELKLGLNLTAPL